MRLIDLTGKRFGLWTVIRKGRSAKAGSRGQGTRVYWLCRCDCGTEKEVMANSLRYNQSKSCGCHKAQFTSEANTINGANRFPREHRIWLSMKARCKYPNRPCAERYHGRGIMVCERWDESFAAFLEDMGPAPSPTHSIDRIDNDGHYEPGNVRWATTGEQARNTRRNHLITFNGETKPLCDWSAQLGFKRGTIEQRINRYGWTPERALTTPPRRWGR